MEGKYDWAEDGSGVEGLDEELSSSSSEDCRWGEFERKASLLSSSNSKSKTVLSCGCTEDRTLLTLDLSGDVGLLMEKSHDSKVFIVLSR